MLYLNNPLFTAVGISSELNKLLDKENQKPINPRAIKGLKNKFTCMYFPNISIDKIKAEIETPLFAEFPQLQFMLRKIFANEEHPGVIVIPPELKDWIRPAHCTQTFQDLNSKYGYYSDKLAEGGIVFDKLQPFCRIMTQLVERQADDNEMAYKLMALFCESKDFEAQDICLKKISEGFVKVSKRFEYIKNHPYHDAFVTELNPFPIAKDAKDIEKWREFILEFGFPGLTVFADCTSFPEAPKTLKEAQTAQLEKTYPRAGENKEFAAFCKSLLIKNDGFESGLDFIKAGWPKKKSDNLPVVDIKVRVETDEYRWVNLRPDDKHALYLGNMIPGCCQFINGNSRQCVIDGISLSDNGFYVLLKKKITQQPATEPKKDGANVLDGDIVAQSYAWISKNGNLCLDSLEWNRDRVSEEILKTLMSKFADQVVQEYPQVKYVNVGAGGQTPRNFYGDALLSETQRQGTEYGDAAVQYCIQSKLNPEVTKRLGEIPEFNRLDGTLQNKIRYLSAYWESKDLSAETIACMSRLLESSFFQPFPPIHQPSIHQPSIHQPLTDEDFKVLTFEDYQKLPQNEQEEISTFRKLLNCESIDGFMRWLPTIPAEELPNIVKTGNKILNLAASKPGSLKTILEQIPKKDLLAAVQVKDINEKTLLHLVASNPASLEVVLNLLPEDARLAAVQVKDINEKTLSHLVASNPDSLKIILEQIPKKDRLAAVQVKDINEKTLLHLVASNPASLAVVLKLLPAENRLTAVQVQDRKGKTALHLFASNPVSLKIILALLPEDDRLAAVQVEDDFQQTVLHLVASNPESLEVILNLLPEVVNLAAVQVKKETVLHLAASNPDSLKIILNKIPEKDRFASVQLKDDYQETVLHRAASNPKSLKILLDQIPAENRLTAVQVQDRDKQTVLHLVASNPESLAVILDLLPEDDRLAEFQKQDGNGNTVLHRAASNPESLKIILHKIPAENRLTAVQVQDRDKQTVLHLVASNPASLELVLNLLPEDARHAAVQVKDDFQQTVLHRAASNPESLKIILDLLPKDVSLDVVQVKDRYEQTVLHRAASNPASLELVLNLLPEDDRLDVVQVKDKYEQTVLHLAARTLESLAVILKLLPEKKRLAAVQLEVEDYIEQTTTVLHLAAKNTYSLKIILDLLLEGERLAGVKTKDIEGKTLLHVAVCWPSYLEEILKCLSPEDRLEAVKSADKEGNTVLHAAVRALRPKSLEAILGIYPLEARLEAVKAADKEGNTVLHAAASRYLLETILKCLSPEDRLEAVKAADKEGKTVGDISTKYFGSSLADLEYVTKNDSTSPASSLSMFKSQEDPECDEMGVDPALTPFKPKA